MLVEATLPVPASLMTLLAGFAPLFTAPSFRTFCGLACGFLAQPGKRTVCGMLAGAGLARCWSHDRAHRVLSRARWSPDELGLAGAKLVAALLVPAGEPVVVAIDDTLFRRRAKGVGSVVVPLRHEAGGQIQISARHVNATEASLEIRDDGPGVPPGRRQEIFKPYFTTNVKGTGLGLAVVQQIVLAHGWEIECLANEPRGAVFRITHLKLAA